MPARKYSPASQKGGNTLKRLAYLAVLLAVLCIPAHAQQKASLSAQSTDCTTAGSCLSVPLTIVGPTRTNISLGSATITVSANASANTLQFEACSSIASDCAANTGWYAITSTQNSASSTTQASSTTGTGWWQFNVGAFTNIRVRCSTFVSGTATVTITTSPASAKAGGGGNGGTTPSSIPGTPGLSAVPVQTNLLAEYRMLPTENPCALVDYSGNGNNATACVGTSPTIISGSGGVLFGGAGAIALPAALNSALSVQIFFVPANNGGAVLAGNGAAANLLLLTVTRVTGTNDSLITGYPSEHNMRILTGRVDTAPFAGLGSYPRAALVSGGAANITWTMNGAAVDAVYLNGTLTNSYITQGNATGNGHQTSGNYQLGGLASGSCTNWSAQLCNYLNSGSKVYYAVFYNRLISATEVQENTVYMNNYLAANGVSLSPYKPADASSSQYLTIAVDGDSLSCGPCASVTPLPANSYTGYLFGLTGPTGSNSTTNQALGGRSLFANLVPAGNQAIDPLYYPYAAGNLTICAFCGTNDGTLAQYQGGLVEWSLDRQKVGWKTCVAGVLDGHGDATKNTFNAWLRQNWRSFANCFVDVAGTTQLGANGAQSNTTDFYTTDNLHIQDNGIINYEAPYIKRAINRLYGNHDFSSATVYVSAAAAAVATTAGTSSATQNVITTAATPANCVAGDWVTVAGVTPAGYNGNFYIIASTGTTITVHNAPSQSSLANITVQGTIVCPQQQDADEYQIVNFGVGNYSLQTCVALTGQNIYIQNINAVATTLLPFASETITGSGATPTTLAANTTAILQAQLVSSAAGGCNWVRLQ